MGLWNRFHSLKCYYSFCIFFAPFNLMLRCTQTALTDYGTGPFSALKCVPRLEKQRG